MSYLPHINQQDRDIIKDYIKDNNLFFITWEEDDIVTFKIFYQSYIIQIYKYLGKYIIHDNNSLVNEFDVSIYSKDKHGYQEKDTIEEVCIFLKFLQDSTDKVFFIVRDLSYNYYDKYSDIKGAVFGDMDIDELNQLESEYDIKLNMLPEIFLNKDIVKYEYISPKGKYNIVSPSHVMTSINYLEHLTFYIYKLNHADKYGFYNFQVHLLLNDEALFPVYQIIDTFYGIEGLILFIGNLMKINNEI